MPCGGCGRRHQRHSRTEGHVCEALSRQAVQMNIHAEFSSAHTQLARGGRGRGVEWSSGSATGSQSEAQPSQQDCSDATLRTMRSAVRLVRCRLFMLAPLGSSRGSTADDRIEPSSAGRAGGGRRLLVRPYRGRVASRWIPEAGPASSRTRRTFGISTTTVCALRWTDSCERKQPFEQQSVLRQADRRGLRDASA